jgi:hypothetical protein
MDYEIFTLYIEKLETYEKELIKLWGRYTQK